MERMADIERSFTDNIDEAESEALLENESGDDSPDENKNEV